MSIITKDIVEERKTALARKNEAERQEIEIFLRPDNLASIAAHLSLLVRKYYLDHGRYPGIQLVDTPTVTWSVVCSEECKIKLLQKLRQVDDRIQDVSFEYDGRGGWVPDWQKSTHTPGSAIVHVRFDIQRLDVLDI
ncbi:hypothetical protein LRM44_03055 [Candidatus Nanosynbacter sp. HMT-352]|jgi:hypothetical protein|uniref:hypothetical protein n=1 Tax=Candidatus Nanosynbacter sp. HMT-352 TaxID=2899133 RepID=UPI001FB6F9AD|nr:hypothetical protein [Candidatus Nanosynbacter sp. HMT-352]UOG66248.1 hypothetical protein LRM44_03055 [Candidatus Nanosynbacter sp. HMT-352]